MSKKDPTAKKLEEGKKAARLANKVATKNATKRKATQMLVNMAGELPAGKAQSFLQITNDIDKLEADKAVINLAMRGKRALLKEMKVELRVYDHVRKLRKMDPEDAKSFKASEAIYTDQLGMELSPQQKEHIEEIEKKRENARALMAEVNGGNTGKEVGSGTITPVGALPSLPERNEALSANFVSPSAGTH